MSESMIMSQVKQCIVDHKECPEDKAFSNFSNIWTELIFYRILVEFQRDIN